MSTPRKHSGSPHKRHHESPYRDSPSRRHRNHDLESAAYTDSPPRTPSKKPKQEAYMQPSSPVRKHHDSEPPNNHGGPTDINRKKSLIRPERRKMDRDHPNYHYRQHAQNMEVYPSTTGVDPLMEEADEADTLINDEKGHNTGDDEPSPRGRDRDLKPVVGNGTKRTRRLRRKDAKTLSDEDKRRQKELEAITPPSLWNIYCRILTWWAPGAILGCFGKPARAQQRAWREKMGLLSIILLIGAFVGFLTFGFTQAVCGTQRERLKVNHVDGGYMIFHGSAYSLDNSHHPAARGILDQQNVLYDLGPGQSYAGMDGSFMFQNVNGACKDMIKLAPDSDVPTNANGDLAWYFPCNAFKQDGSSKPNLTIPYYLGYACHTTVNGRKAFYGLKSSGDVYYTWDDIKNSTRNLMVYNGNVLDLSLLQWLNKTQVTWPPIFDKLQENPSVRGIDVTHAFLTGSNRQLGQCLSEIIKVGSIDTESVGCVASKVVLYVSLVFILAIVMAKFLLAIAFQWFFSRRFAASTASITKNPKKRNQQIEDWADDIYRAPPKFTEAGMAASDKSSKRSSVFLPSTSRFTSPYAQAALAKGRPAPTTMASQSSTARLIRPMSMYEQPGGSELTLPSFDPTNRHSVSASRSSLMMSGQDKRFSSVLGDPDAGPAGFIHEAVVPQPPPEWEPFGYPLAHTICLVTAYSEGYDGLRTTLDSIAMTEYPNSHKAMFVVCDGMIKGAGEELTTPEIALSMMKDHAVLPDEVQAYSCVAVASGSKRHNMAKVYSGFYDYGEESPIPLNKRQRVPMMVVVKCGTPDEASSRKPGNRGKRDSQIILMSFLQKVMFDERMTELEYEMFNGLWRVTGISPDFYEIVLMVDADTKVFPDSLTHMVSAMIKDPEIMGLCGETKIANKRASWVSMIQVFEYFISHHLSKSFESVFGGVTCLPGCFCMYRIKAPKGGQNYWVPILANPDVVERYSENVVDTLHKKNLLLLGEDRYLSTLMLKTFPKRKQVFVPQGVCKTTVPEEFRVLLSQRRRWINSTVHNLMELVLVRDLCGTFCFSMQFVVFIELVGTLVLPAAISFTFYLVIISIVRKPTPIIPLVLLALILGLPAVLIVLTAHRWSYVLWMLIYLVSLPIWNFVLPAYAFWKFDDFSWGDTRKTAGEKTKKAGIEYEGEFDSSKITMKRWGEFEKGPYSLDEREWVYGGTGGARGFCWAGVGEDSARWGLLGHSPVPEHGQAMAQNLSQEPVEPGNEDGGVPLPSQSAGLVSIENIDLAWQNHLMATVEAEFQQIIQEAVEEEQTSSMPTFETEGMEVWQDQEEGHIQNSMVPSHSHPTVPESLQPSIQFPDHDSMHSAHLPFSEEQAGQEAMGWASDHFIHSATVGETAAAPLTWASPEDPLPLHPLQPIMSNLSGAGDATAIFNPQQQLEDEPPPMPVGDVNSGETLPTGQYLFTDPPPPPPPPALPELGDESLESAVLPDPHCGLMPSIQDTFAFWRNMWSTQARAYPYISRLAEEHIPRQRPNHITPDKMAKEGHDMQGIHWNWYNTTKETARGVRRMVYKNYANEDAEHLQSEDHWGSPAYGIDFSSPTAPKIADTERFFNFRSTNTKIIPRWWHYQLRHNIFAASQNAIYYHVRPFSMATMDTLASSRRWSVNCYNPQSCTTTPVMTPASLEGEAGQRLDAISTLTADCGVLVVGTVPGMYGLRSLSLAYNAPSSTGQIVPPSAQALEVTENSINHVYTTFKRSSSSSFNDNSVPGSDVLAIFSANDCTLRTLDCGTNTFLGGSGYQTFDSAINCACSSPDARLRLTVSDANSPVITSTDTGEILHSLPGHNDHGFACAWAPDHVTLATAHQDGLVQIFDARYLDKAVHRIPAEQSCVRTLQFSPLGGGRPILVAAEPADFVHVIDAKTFDRKQSIEFFGDVSGASMSADGQSLFIGCSDKGFGGLLEFERDQGWQAGGRAGFRPRLLEGDGDCDDEEGEESVGRLRKQDFSAIFPGREDLWRERRRLEIAAEGDWMAQELLERDQRVGAGMVGLTRGMGTGRGVVKGRELWA
ncbi:uncharacterized protein KY384_008598 [Bacidia gigantensis]|uniref:uncharacterized protein n=1 Tax=Bacidia gigantensis TaxID=2732470 RepID=UPI001D039532|nr:uncharacterized protein KY384_008598 [Bacidia gigantensis]KAG8527168.1 hypothetical protein KY384_008598 [Bacidia gigantensis]